MRLIKPDLALDHCSPYLQGRGLLCICTARQSHSSLAEVECCKLHANWAPLFAFKP